MTFIPGWHPAYAEAALAAPHAVDRFCESSLADTVPLPASFSLSKFRHWPFDQGRVGSCFANAVTQAFQILTTAAVASGGEWTERQLSRRLVWYQGRKLDGLLGSRQDGGSVTNATLALGLAPHGVGDADENAWPYQDNHAWLEQTPPQPVFDLAGRNRVKEIKVLSRLDDSAKRLILNGYPVSIGIWWPYHWDSRGATFIDDIGPGTYGHALCVIGWMKKNGRDYWQIENSHGPIYKPLSQADAATVPNYKPAQADATFDFWVNDECLQKVIGYGQSELVTPIGIDGLVERSLMYESMMST